MIEFGSPVWRFMFRLPISKYCTPVIATVTCRPVHTRRGFPSILLLLRLALRRIHHAQARWYCMRASLLSKKRSAAQEQLKILQRFWKDSARIQHLHSGAQHTHHQQSTKHTGSLYSGPSLFKMTNIAASHGASPGTPFFWISAMHAPREALCLLQGPVEPPPDNVDWRRPFPLLSVQAPSWHVIMVKNGFILNSPV